MKHINSVAGASYTSLSPTSPSILFDILSFLDESDTEAEPLLKEGRTGSAWNSQRCPQTKTYPQQHQGDRRVCIVCIHCHGVTPADRSRREKRAVCKKDPIFADNITATSFGRNGDVLCTEKHLFTFATAPGFFHNAIYSWASGGKRRFFRETGSLMNLKTCYCPVI